MTRIRFQGTLPCPACAGHPRFWPTLKHSPTRAGQCAPVLAHPAPRIACCSACACGCVNRAEWPSRSRQPPRPSPAGAARRGSTQFREREIQMRQRQQVGHQHGVFARERALLGIASQQGAGDLREHGAPGRIRLQPGDGMAFDRTARSAGRRSARTGRNRGSPSPRPARRHRSRTGWRHASRHASMPPAARPRGCSAASAGSKGASSERQSRMDRASAVPGRRVQALAIASSGSRARSSASPASPAAWLGVAARCNRARPGAGAPACGLHCVHVRCCAAASTRVRRGTGRRLWPAHAPRRSIRPARSRCCPRHPSAPPAPAGHARADGR